MSLEDTLRKSLGVENIESEQANLKKEVESKPGREEVKAIAQQEINKRFLTGPDWFQEVAGFYQSPPALADKSKATHVVTDKDSFLSAIKNEGAYVWVPGDARIDLTGVVDAPVSHDVTIASNRNHAQGKRGGHIYVGDFSSDSGQDVLRSYAKNLTITGLRLEGPDTSWIKTYDSGKKRAFGLFLGANNVFHNNEAYGWTFSPFLSGSRGRTPSHTYSYNHIHDCLLEGLGYGAELYNGQHEFAYNYFDRTRHAIAGFGYDTNGYEAHHNIVGPEPLSHPFDMHDLGSNVSGGGNVAGGTINIHDNAFLFTTDIRGNPQEAIAIRGVPADRCDIKNNYFLHSSKPDGTGDQGSAYRQEEDSWKNVYAEGNTFGEDLRFEVPK